MEKGFLVAHPNRNPLSTHVLGLANVAADVSLALAAATSNLWLTSVLFRTAHGEGRWQDEYRSLRQYRRPRFAGEYRELT